MTDIPEIKTQPKKPKLNLKQLATQAGELMQNPAFQAAMAAVRETYTAEMVNTRPEDVAKREHFHKCIHAAADIEAALTAFIEHGKMQALMNRKKEKAKK